MQNFEFFTLFNTYLEKSFENHIRIDSIKNICNLYADTLAYLQANSSLPPCMQPNILLPVKFNDQQMALVQQTSHLLFMNKHSKY